MIDLGAALGRAFSRIAPVPGSALAQELAEERAAIMEYDGRLTREEAEQLAGLNTHPAGSQQNYNDTEKQI